MEATEYHADGITPAATWVLRAEVLPSGAVTDLTCGRIAPAVPLPADVVGAATADPGSTPDGAAVFTDFCAALAEGPASAARCFSDDGVFSHAPFVADRPRVLATGRGAIETALQDRRPGPPNLELVTLAQLGRWVMIEGWGNGPQGRKPFLSSFTMSADGALQRYLSVGVTRHS